MDTLLVLINLVGTVLVACAFRASKEGEPEGLLARIRAAFRWSYGTPVQFHRAKFVGGLTLLFLSAAGSIYLS